MKNKENKNEIIDNIILSVNDSINDMGLEDIDKDTIESILDMVSEMEEYPKFNDNVIDIVYSGIEREVNGEDTDEVWGDISNKLEKVL
jgi:hypothetical protein